MKPASPWLLASACAVLLLLSAQAPAGGVSPTPLERVILERVLRTPEGAGMAALLLGSPSLRFNSLAGSREVLNTLMHPRNAEIGEAVLRRLAAIEEELLRLPSARRSRSDASPLTAAEEAVVLEEARRLFVLSGNRRPGEVTFSDGRSYRFQSAFEGRSRDFMMNGSRLPAPGARVDRRQPRPAGLHPDAYEQFLLWEEGGNLGWARETEQAFGLEVASVPASEVEVIAASDASEGVRRLFVQGDRVLWPKHPYNRDDRVPFFSAPAVEHWPARFTASRSVAIQEPASGRALSIKAPTDTPHRGSVEERKVHSQADVQAAIPRTELLISVDRELGADSRLIVLKEILAIREKSSGNGIVVRDLAPLQGGQYYLPAFSLPYAGREIARRLGVPFEVFGEQAYARALGVAKARFLLRYGLQLETPNAQNILIELDRSLRPTGRIVLRDISDSEIVEPVLRALGKTAWIKQDRRMDFALAQLPMPRARSSFFLMSYTVDAGTLGPRAEAVPADIIHSWCRAHDEAYVQELARLLEIELTPTRLRALLEDFTGFDLADFLFSAQNLERIRRLHEAARAGQGGPFRR